LWPASLGVSSNDNPGIRVHARSQRAAASQHAE